MFCKIVCASGALANQSSQPELVNMLAVPFAGASARAG